jgi:hypothetical protein
MGTEAASDDPAGAYRDTGENVQRRNRQQHGL